MDVCLRVLKEAHKNRYDTYSVRKVPCFATVMQLKQYFLQNCKEEIFPATDTTFQIGYYADRNKKFSISSEIQLAEAFSLVKNGMITLWVVHIKTFQGVLRAKREKVRNTISHVLHVLLHQKLSEIFSLVLSDNDYDYHYSDLGNPSSARDDSGDGEEENSYDSCLSRLREKHTLPEFKLRCWARMVVRKI